MSTNPRPGLVRGSVVAAYLPGIPIAGEAEGLLVSEPARGAYPPGISFAEEAEGR